MVDCQAFYLEMSQKGCNFRERRAGYAGPQPDP